MMKSAMCVVAAVLGASSLAAADLPTDRSEIYFDVFREGSRFGSHVVRFDAEGDELRVDVAIDLSVSLGPVNLFRYEHESREVWRDGELIALSSETLDSGERSRIEAERAGEAFSVTSTADPAAEPVPAVLPPSSHWQGYPDGLDTMFNTVTGEAMPVNLAYIGREEIFADGQWIQADRYRLEGSLTVDLWYDLDGVWAKCAFDARGQAIEYVRRAPGQDAPSRRVRSAR